MTNWQHGKAETALPVLLDTHAFLWWLADSTRLSRAAYGVIAEEANHISVSAASAWEIATKYRLGRLPQAEAAVSTSPVRSPGRDSSQWPSLSRTPGTQGIYPVPIAILSTGC